MEWVAEQLVGLEKDEKITVVAEVDGRTVGHVLVKLQGRRSSHVGSLTTIVLNGYRCIEIGTELLKKLSSSRGDLG